MKWSNKILLIIVFLASTVYLNRMKRFSKLKVATDQVLEIYKRSSSPENQSEINVCKRKQKVMPLLLESNKEIQDELLSSKMR